MVKPKLISAIDVRITLIKVRSALMRESWNDIPVRRLDISVRRVDSAVRWVESLVRCSDYSTEARSESDLSTTGIAITGATAPSDTRTSSMVGALVIVRAGQKDWRVSAGAFPSARFPVPAAP